jgi:hypothetical protein
MIISFIRDGDHEEETPPKGCLFPGGQSVAPGPRPRDRCQFAVFHREQIKRHCIKALAGRFRAEELSGRCPGRFAAHHDLVSQRLDVLNRPTQVWDSRARICHVE